MGDMKQCTLRHLNINAITNKGTPMKTVAVTCWLTIMIQLTLAVTAHYAPLCRHSSPWISYHQIDCVHINDTHSQHYECLGAIKSFYKRHDWSGNFSVKERVLALEHCSGKPSLPREIHTILRLSIHWNNTGYVVRQPAQKWRGSGVCR